MQTASAVKVVFEFDFDLKRRTNVFPIFDIFHLSPISISCN